VVAGWRTVASGSDDKTVRLWDAASGRARHKLEGHSDYVRSVAWSPDGGTVASGSDDNTVRLWDAASGRARHRLEGHSNLVVSVAWSPDGGTVASGSDDKTVRLWDAASGREKLVLEGHEAGVMLLAWSPDSRILASMDSRNALRIWDTANGQLIHQLPARTWRHWPAGLEAGRTPVWDNGDFLVTAAQPGVAPAAARQILETSAKVVLAGDSYAGKTCLARRLAEDRYEEGQPTTHGMQIWTLSPEKLDPGGTAPEGQQREIFLWDLGGQDEYQLVNQLFLRDTTVALVLFDATRGAVGLESAEAWNERLLAQTASPPHRLLIQAKADLPAWCSRMTWRRCASGSGSGDPSPSAPARTGTPASANSAGSCMRPSTGEPGSRQPAAGVPRDPRIPGQRASGRRMRHVLRRSGAPALPWRHSVRKRELETTLGHLAREGQIVDVRLQSGDRAVVLRVDMISRYAGSLVQAAAPTPAACRCCLRTMSCLWTWSFRGLLPANG